MNLEFEKFKNSKSIYLTHLENEKNIKEKLEILKIKNNKIKTLNPTENEYEELVSKRNINKNIKKYNEISNEIKNLISEFNSNNHLNLIEKNLNKLMENNEEFLDISQKFASSILDINELINELENRFNYENYDEIDFNEIDEKIYQYQQLSKFFNVDPKVIFN